MIPQHIQIAYNLTCICCQEIMFTRDSDMLVPSMRRQELTRIECTECTQAHKNQHYTVCVVCHVVNIA